MTGSLERECPCCGSVDIDEELERYRGICDECGFVIEKDPQGSAPDWYVETTRGEGADQNWESTYRVGSAPELRLASALNVLESIADEVDLSDEMRYKVAELFCDAHVARITDGRDSSAMIAGCIRLVSTQTSVPIPLKILSELAEVDQSQIRASLIAIQDEFGDQQSIPEPVEYLNYLDKRLDLSEEELAASRELVRSIQDDHEMVGTNPAATAASSVYVSNNSRTQKEVARAVGVSAETIRKRSEVIS